ncbi:MFS transporter [Nocardioides sp. OK12]|nr:MFS transporter [Nocardioides sp. OK12]
MNSTHTPLAKAEGHPPRPSAPNKAVILAVATLLIFTLDAEAFALIPILADLVVHYGLSPVQLTWTLAVMGLVGAGTIPILARVGDLFGIRRVMIISSGIAATGAVLAALADGATLLIIGRAMTAVGAACLPLLYAYMRSFSDSNDSVDFAAGFMTAVIGAGLVVSFLLGGFVIKVGGTAQTVLAIIAALAVLGFVLLWLLPEVSTRVVSSIDYVGAGLLVAALTALTLGLSQGNRWEWTSGRVVALLVLGVAGLLLWVAWELRATNPIIDLRVLGRREVWPACVVAAFGSFLAGSFVLTASQYMATPEVVGYGFGMTSFSIGLYFLPLGIIIGFGGLTLRPLLTRLGLRDTAVLGGVISTIGFIWFTLDETPSRTDYLLIMVVWAFSYLLMVTAAAAAYMRASRPGEEGMVAGGARVVATGLGALGPAIVSAILTSSFIPQTAVPQGTNYNGIWLFIAVCTGLVTVTAMLIRPSETRSDLAPNTVLADEGDSAALSVP